MDILKQIKSKQYLPPVDAKCFEIFIEKCGVEDNLIGGEKIFRCDDLGDAVALYWGDRRSRDSYCEYVKAKNMTLTTNLDPSKFMYYDSEILVIPKDLLKTIGKHLIDKYETT